MSVRRRMPPQIVMMNARHSVVKLAMLCGPMTRVGSLSPTFTSSQ